MYCTHCNFAFFNPRPDDNELSKLYSHYRGLEYQKRRFKTEKWYTKKINHLVGNGITEIRNRNNNLIEIIKKNNVPIKTIKNILDFGGDRGQFIPNIFKNVPKYVYEISEVTPIAGVKKINPFSMKNTDKLKQFDFIICAHVLEHVSQPVTIVRQLKQCAHNNTLFYFEVPVEFPVNYFSNTLIKDVVLSVFLYSPNSIKRFLPLFKIPSRFTMHEHINKFSVSSMKNLLIQEGFKITYINQKKLDFGWAKLNILSCMAEMRS